MSMSDSILTILNIQDKNIHFDDNFVEEVHSNGKISIDFKAILTYDTPSFCPCCGTINQDNSIVKNGTTKPSKIILPAVSGRNAYLHLRKQRWFCRNCESTFSASSPIVDKNCYISRNTKLAVRLESKKKLSQKDIAEDLNISHGTVNSLLSRSYKEFIIKKNFLPRHLCFDEFKSVKKSKGKTSFLFLDADTGKVIDVLEYRG